MGVGTADFSTAMSTLWTASGLDGKFNALWDGEAASRRVALADLKSEFPTLHDGEATPKQPFPYCVMGVVKPRVLARMTGGEGSKRQINEFLVTLTVQASRRTGDARSAKQIAAYLAEEIMKVLGGHPTVVPTDLTLENGGHLLAQLTGEWPERTEQYNYRWILNYRFLLDVPAAVAA